MSGATSGGDVGGAACACAWSEVEYRGAKVVHHSPPEQHEHGRLGCTACPWWQRSPEKEKRRPPYSGGRTSAGEEDSPGAPRWPLRDLEIDGNAFCPRPAEGGERGTEEAGERAEQDREPKEPQQGGGEGEGATVREPQPARLLPCEPQEARRCMQADSMERRNLRSLRPKPAR